MRKSLNTAEYPNDTVGITVYEQGLLVWLRATEDSGSSDIDLALDPKEARKVAKWLKRAAKEIESRG